MCVHIYIYIYIYIWGWSTSSQTLCVARLTLEILRFGLSAQIRSMISRAIFRPLTRAGRGKPCAWRDLSLRNPIEEFENGAGLTTCPEGFMAAPQITMWGHPWAFTTLPILPHRYGGSTSFVQCNYIVSSLVLNGTSTILGVTFGTGKGGENVTHKIVPFSVSVLAVVTNRLETAISAITGTDRGTTWSGTMLTPSPPMKSFPIKSPWVKLSGRPPIKLNRHENAHPWELRVCLSQTLWHRNSC